MPDQIFLATLPGEQLFFLGVRSVAEGHASDLLSEVWSHLEPTRLASVLQPTGQVLAMPLRWSQLKSMVPIAADKPPCVRVHFPLALPSLMFAVQVLPHAPQSELPLDYRAMVLDARLELHSEHLVSSRTQFFLPTGVFHEFYCIEITSLADSSADSQRVIVFPLLNTKLAPQELLLFFRAALVRPLLLFLLLFCLELFTLLGLSICLLFLRRAILLFYPHIRPRRPPFCYFLFCSLSLSRSLSLSLSLSLSVSLSLSLSLSFSRSFFFFSCLFL